METQLRETLEDTVTNSSRWDSKTSPKLLPVMPVVMKKRLFSEVITGLNVLFSKSYLKPVQWGGF